MFTSLKTWHTHHACLIGLLLLILNILPGQALRAQSCFNGLVIHATGGESIQGAYVKAGNMEVILSGKAGDFRICGIHTDSILLEVTHLGFVPFKARVRVAAGSEKPFVVRMTALSIPIGEVVISATRTETKILETPVRVNLITSKTLQGQVSQKVDEVLQVVPGININRPFGPLSSKATVTMRGVNGKEQGRVLVLMDGIPVNKSDGGTVDWNMFDREGLDRIEVTKGAGSSVYGGNAMGGIINMISKSPEKGFSGKATVEYGTYNTLGARLNLSDAVEKEAQGKLLYWSALLFGGKSDGYITQSAYDQLVNPYITKSNMQEAGLVLKGGCRLKGGQQIEARLNVFDDRRGTGEKVYQPEGNTTDHDSQALSLNYKGMAGPWDIRSDLFFQQEHYKKVNEYIKDDYTWYEVLSVRQDAGWMNSFSRKAGKRHRITAGFDLKTGSVDAADTYYTSSDIVYNKGRMNTGALFVQDEMLFFREKMRLVAGIRYDHAVFTDGSFRIERPTRETDFMKSYQVPDMPVQNWNALSPRISLQVSPAVNSRIYLLYSRGFRAAVLDDLCRSGRVKGGFKIANPALKPEYMHNIEAGADRTLDNGTALSFSVYHSRGNDFHYYVSNGQTIDMGFGDRPVFVRSNISDIRISGAEAEIRMEPVPRLSLFVNYGYNDAVILSYHKLTVTDTIDLSGKNLTDVPMHVASAGGNWMWHIVNISFTVRYNGSMWINDQNIMDDILLRSQYPDYTTFDLRLWKNLPGGLGMSLMAQNLFDVKYYDSKDAVGPGRMLTAQITYQFGKRK